MENKNIENENNKENIKKCDLNHKCFCECKNCQKREERRLYFGAIILFLGVFFLASNLGIFGNLDFSKTWPILLIIPGILLMMKGLSFRKDS